MLWEAAVGRRLWAGHAEAAILYKLQSNQIPSPREARPDVPEALDAICMRALAHDPAQRYASAAELRDAVEAFAATLPNRPSRRALGETMTNLFTVERSEVRRVVEDQLGQARAASTDQFSISGTLSKMPGPTESSSSLVQQVSTVPTGSTRVTVATSVMPTSTSRVPIIVGAVALVGAALTLAFVIRSRSSESAPSDSNAANSAANVAASANPIVTANNPPAPSRRTLAVDPPSAIVTIDGRSLAQGATFVEGTQPVAIHAEAPGFAAASTRRSISTRAIRSSCASRHARCGRTHGAPACECRRDARRCDCDREAHGRDKARRGKPNRRRILKKKTEYHRRMLRRAWLVACGLFLAGCGGGLHLTPIRATSNRPSNVVVYFKVQNGHDPVGGLTAESFKIYEDGDLVSQYESKQTILNPEVAASHYTLLLVDMSGSITDSGAVDTLVDAASGFAERIEGQKQQKVAVYAFSGDEHIHAIVPFTTAAWRLKAAVRITCRIQACRSKHELERCDRQEGLNELDKALQSAPNPLRFGTLVVFTDGTDRARRVKWDDVKSALDKTPYEVFAIGLGAEMQDAQLSAIGKDGTAKAAGQDGPS